MVFVCYFLNLESFVYRIIFPINQYSVEHVGTHTSMHSLSLCWSQHFSLPEPRQNYWLKMKTFLPPIASSGWWSTKVRQEWVRRRKMVRVWFLCFWRWSSAWYSSVFIVIYLTTAPPSWTPFAWLFDKHFQSHWRKNTMHRTKKKELPNINHLLNLISK